MKKNTLFAFLSALFLMLSGCGKDSATHCQSCVCTECPCVNGGACATPDCHCDCEHCQHDNSSNHSDHGGCDGGVCPHP